MTEQQTMEQRIFSSRYIERLYIELTESEDYSKYELDEFPYEEDYPKGGTGITVPESIELVMPEGSDRKDLENTKILYEAYRSLTPTQASDARLWTHLTHVNFWNYMQQRWPLNEAKKPINRVRDRYFLRSLKLETLIRNGLSRLWWYGFLTYDENRSNPWELTEILLSRADLAVGITERAFGCNVNIRTAILEFLAENPDVKESENLSRELLVRLNLVGGVKNLPFLEIEEIKSVLKEIRPAV